YTSTGIDLNTQQLKFIHSISPEGLTVDNFGNLYVINTATNPVTIGKYNSNGIKQTEFNTKGKNSTGPIASEVRDVAFDPREGGFIYVLGNVNGTNVVLRYDAEGNFQRSFGGEAGMEKPYGITVSNDGSVFV